MITQSQAANEKTSRRDELIAAFQKVRENSIRICEPLEIEDYTIQSMPDVSPPKWHLAHTTWLFEAFFLMRFKKSYRPFDPQFLFLFNSYYKSLGPHLYRPNRGFLSRPGLPVVLNYRKTIDAAVCDFLTNCDQATLSEVAPIVELGLNHEEQHQELLVTDIKHILCTNPTHPVYIKNETIRLPNARPEPMRWIDLRGGMKQLGATDEGFAYDNERPWHEAYLADYQLASRLVTNGEFIEFIESGAYSKPELWLSLGWDTILKEHWEAPLYWEKQDGQWWVSTLNGFERVRPEEPVCHVSYFEADAFARWKGARLPTEAEWENAAGLLPKDAHRRGINDLSSGALRPLAAGGNAELQQMFGDVWEWTASSYLPYPGFKPLTGPEGEYNGKFMCNQMVLRGGSCATPAGHIRSTYRNYFPPHSRWQFMGIRLAKDSPNHSQGGEL